MIWLFRYVSEYQTERELFESLSDDNLDKIWLLNCSSHSDHPILIVGDAGENVAIGAEVQVMDRDYRDDEDLQNFTNCLMKKWGERNEKTSPNALGRFYVSGQSSGSNGMHNWSNQDRQRGADNIKKNKMDDPSVSLGNLNIKEKKWTFILRRT